MSDLNDEYGNDAVVPRRTDDIARRYHDAEADNYGIEGPMVLGPGPPPEDGSCGQFAVQFHLTTATVARLKSIADARGMSVPELCRQVVGVFVAQQQGDLGALLAAEAEVADYRPGLSRGRGSTD